MANALITGITGQDGRYLADYLYAKGYHVFGVVNGQRDQKANALLDSHPFVTPLNGDLGDLASLAAAITEAQPDEIYNLGSISLVSLSFLQPWLTSDVTGLGVLRMLTALRMAAGSQAARVRFYQASSSEMFGQARESPQNELTPFNPRSPYGIAKAFGHHTAVNHREAYGLHACTGILFNHESPLRGPEFVTRKISRAVARIHLGLQRELVLGNLDAKRDWGFAGDYVEAMWLILQQDQADDYVIATGQNQSVRDLLDFAFGYVGISDWRPYVRTDPRLMRPAEVDNLIGDASKAERILRWKPHVAFSELVEMMVRHDLETEGQQVDEGGAASDGTARRRRRDELDELARRRADAGRLASEAASWQQ